MNEYGTQLTAHSSQLTAHSIALIAKELKISEAIDYFENIKFENNNRDIKDVKTIGIFFSMMYNGGAQHVVAASCQIWDNMGYKVVLYTTEPPNPKDYYYPETVKRIVIPNYINLEARLAKLEQSLKEEHVDLFVYHAWLYPSLLYDMMLMKSLNIKFIVHAHGLFVWPYSHFNIYSANSHRIFGMCDAVATLADMSNDFYKLCGCASYLVQNPVPDYLKNINKTANLNSKKILWLGRIDAGKRLIDAVKIFERVHEKFPDYTLEVVGRDFDNSFPAVKKYCDAKNLNNFINFQGYQTDVNKFYQDAALMLITSEMEGYPYTLLESKAHGLPTVMYSLPYLSLVKDGKG
ncbi:MAG: glycosyltransferase family 4 protein, partial [Synergistaceae bacterium]|nr:glycosyltransferase family 4 protein [Synergistaceae bacterium]